MTKSLRTANMYRTLNRRSPDQETGVQTATCIINIEYSAILEDYSMNCTELLLPEKRTEFPHLLNRAITLVAM